MRLFITHDNTRYRVFFILSYVILILIGGASTVLLNSVYYTNAKIEADKYQFEKSQLVMLKIKGFFLHATQLANTLRVMTETLDEKMAAAATPEQLKSMTKEVEEHLYQIVESGPEDLIYGSGVWYEPYAFDPNNRYFGPYVHRGSGQNQLDLTYEWTTPEYDFHHQPWYLAAIQSPSEPAFTGPYFDGGILYMTLALTFKDKKSGKIKGVLSIDMILPQLQKLVEHASFGSSDIIYVVNRSRKIIAHAKPHELLEMVKSHRPNDESIKSLLDIEADQGTLVLKHPVVYSEKIKTNGWDVVVASEQEVLFARYLDIRNLFFATLAVYIIFITAALLGIYFVLTKFSRLRRAAYDAINHEKNQNQAILDNVPYGLLCADKDGIIQPGYSRYCTKILSDDKQLNLAEVSFYDVFCLSGRYRNHVESFYRQVFNVPEMAPEFAHLIPNEFEVNNKLVEITFSPVFNKGILDKMLLSFADVTLIKGSEKENSKNRALITIIENLPRFELLIREIFSFNERELLLDGNSPIEQRLALKGKIHTWKGDLSVYQLIGLVSHLQMLENLFEEPWVAYEAIYLFKQFKLELMGYLNEHQNLLRLSPKDGSGKHDLNLDNEHKNSLIVLQDSDFIAAYFKAAACEIANRLHKKVRVEYLGRKIIFPLEYRDLIESFIHVIRNAVDHGLEDKESRSGKNVECKIEIDFKELEDSYYLAIADDGRGINVEALKNKVISQGLETEESWHSLSSEQKMEYVFVDNISTKNYVTDISGRGVGLSVLYNNVKKLGGKITIKTELGVGTKFECLVPKIKTLPHIQDHSADKDAS